MQEITIDIQAPCGEKWTNMSISNDGRHCANCDNTVIDFSKMHDDEIIKYFSEHSNFCGRFRNDQLQRPIIRSANVPFKRSIKIPTKIAACIFTLASLKSVTSTAQSKTQQTEVLPSVVYEKHQGKIELMGFIKDDAENLIKGVDVFLDNQKVTQSDENGFYKIKLVNPLLKSHTIAFSKHQYRSTALSFHPLMDNTNYNVKMCNYESKECHSHSMGMPMVPNFSAIYFGKISFLRGRKLKHAVINRLKEIAHTMRSNPSVEVRVNYYFAKEREEKSHLIDAHQIVNYMVDEQGMDRGRFHIVVLKNKAKAKTLEFSNHSKYH